MEPNEVVKAYMAQYSDFMNDVLDLHEAFGIPVEECVEIVIKRYPDFTVN